MNGAGFADIIGFIVGFALTIMVLSYIIGDNIFFRLAIYIFIGVASGYAAMLVLYNVLWYQLLLPLIKDPSANLYLTIPPLLLGLWMLTKISRRLARWGGPVLAFLVGVGAATVIGGAILGTIVPQAEATINVLDPQTAGSGGENVIVWFVNGVIILAGTLATLGYFHFGIGGGTDTPPRWYAFISGYLAPAGKVFVAITFGALFAGVYSAALMALIERVNYLWSLVVQILPF